MKFNWGTGILISIIAFCSIMIATGIFLINQKVDLVADDYYERTLVYQDQIDRENKTRALHREITFSSESTGLDIILPQDIKGKKIEGTIHFYRPSDKNLDFRLPLSVSEGEKMSIPGSKLLPGLWKVKISWSADGEEYYSEQSYLAE